MSAGKQQISGSIDTCCTQLKNGYKR